MTQQARVITSIDQISEEWLKSVLRGSGALVSGDVSDLQVDFLASTNAHIARIRIQYTRDARGRLPRSLILKMCNAENEFVKDSEVNYYARDYVHLSDAPIPVCYDAQYSHKNESYHILMEDLSDTHQNDTPTTLDSGIAVAKALAKLQAFGWGEKRVRALDSSMPDPTKLDRYLGHMRQGLVPVLESTESEIDSSWREAILEIFEHHPAKMVERIKNPAGFTVVHGDLNPGNILSPKNPDGRVYFLDRQPLSGP